MLPDVHDRGEIANVPFHDEKIEMQEWSAKFHLFGAKFPSDQQRIKEISKGIDTLKDVLDWIQTARRAKLAETGKKLGENHMAHHFPVISVGDISELPGQLAQVLEQMDASLLQPTPSAELGGGQVKRTSHKRLLIIHLEFNSKCILMALLLFLVLTHCCFLASNDFEARNALICEPLCKVFANVMKTQGVDVRSWPNAYYGPGTEFLCVLVSHATREAWLHWRDEKNEDSSHHAVGACVIWTVTCFKNKAMSWISFG